MIAALLITAAAPSVPLSRPQQAAVDVERTFAADAQKLGQWTAFRKYAGFAGVMFVPKAVNAWEWLGDRKNPAKAVRWQPAQSYESCDGRAAINVGPWQAPDGTFGYFTTVWKYEHELRDGPKWLWAYDQGQALKVPMKAPRMPLVRRASCHNIPAKIFPSGRYAIPSAPVPDSPEAQEAQIESWDRSLRYDYSVDAAGGHRFKAWLWNGAAFEPILDQVTPAPPK